ncbi:MAG: anti-sigma factor antagonist [Armatimonadetes bacterium]|nr:anti-sigma factor antagonist [Armatimonadota bacterium]MDW8029535.1 anti-sigma factor antagonist [Armatimonadota bacterium]
MPLQVNSRKLDNGVVLMELKGSVDASVQNELTDAIDEVIKEAEKGVIISLDGVEFIDSSGIGALMKAWGEAENNGLKFAVILKQPRLRKLLDTLGLLDTLPNFLTVSDALEEWKTQEERERFEVMPLIPTPVAEREQITAAPLPMMVQWQMELQLACEPELITVARLACASFASQFGFGIDEVEDIKLAVSEACTNVIQHAYEERQGQKFVVRCWTEQNSLIIEVCDWGKGLPFGFQTHFGMKIIQAVMDDVNFISEGGKGTIVRMVKRRRI